MATLIRLPITNAILGGGYTGAVALGGRPPVQVIVDTGSSTLAVDGAHFDPAAATATRTTNLAQAVSYGAGGWIGAVVQTAVGLTDVTLVDAHLTVTYGESTGMFGAAQGILGLAYAPLDSAHVVPGDAWAAKFPPAEVQASPTVELAPYFTQLEVAGVVKNKFALAVRRASTRLATADPATDPANQGVLVLGGGEEATDLYRGDFTVVEVIHDVWYNTRLVEVQVGDQPPIAVAPLPPGDPLQSNSIVDSGTSALLFTPPLYQAILAAFHAVDPAFDGLLTAHAAGGPGLAHAALDLARWPPLALRFEAHGGTATVAIAPDAYWQLDAAGPGLALAYLASGQAGRSILGLPLFAGRYVVFDRSRDGGVGEIRFAALA